VHEEKIEKAAASGKDWVQLHFSTADGVRSFVVSRELDQDTETIKLYHRMSQEILIC
jgi:hypothetical protein